MFILYRYGKCVNIQTCMHLGMIVTVLKVVICVCVVGAWGGSQLKPKLCSHLPGHGCETGGASLSEMSLY